MRGGGGGREKYDAAKQKVNDSRFIIHAARFNARDMKDSLGYRTLELLDKQTSRISSAFPVIEVSCGN